VGASTMMKLVSLAVLSLFLSISIQAEVNDSDKCSLLNYAIYDAHEQRNSATFWTNEKNGIENTKYLKFTKTVNDTFASIESQYDAWAKSNNTKTIKQYVEEGLDPTNPQGNAEGIKRRRKIRRNIISHCSNFSGWPILRASFLAIGRIVSPL